MPHIIIRPSGYSSKKHSAPRFSPHYNRTLEKYYASSSEYYSDLKRKGLAPYDPTSSDQGKRKPYVASKKVREIVSTITASTKKGKFKAEDNLISAMKSVGVKGFEQDYKKSDLAKLPGHYQPKSNEGGFYDAAQ